MTVPLWRYVSESCRDFWPIRAVAIDDEPSHLLGLTTGLTAIGIPCMASGMTGLSIN